MKHVLISFLWLIFSLFCAGFLDCLQAMTKQKSLERQRVYALKFLWQDHLGLNIRYRSIPFDQKNAPLWKSVEFNSCGEYAIVRALGNYWPIYVDEYVCPKYLEDYTCSFERSFKGDVWDMRVCGKVLRIIDVWTGQIAYEINIKNFVAVFKVDLLSNYVRFKGNKDFCLLPVQKENRKKYVYLFRFTHDPGKPLKIVANIGNFGDAQCGAIDPTSRTIVICDAWGEIHIFRLKQKALNRIDV